MKKIKQIKISSNATIKTALKVISRGGLQIAVVVDKNEKLLGTLTDGDIRGGFLKGLNLSSSIKSIFFKKPLTVKKNVNKKKILEIALLKKIYQIPVIDNSNKVVGIYVLDELIKSRNKSNLVVIMAGGRGVRLRPLTKNIPKPMLKVGNKPIIQNILEKFRDNDYKNFLISVNYKSKIIKDYFGDGAKFGVNIQYIEEKTRLGTAGSLSLIKNITKPFFVINGDLMINLDFEKMMSFHYDHNSMATMCVKEYNFNSSYGEVKLKNENIVSIDEKPKHKYYINGGLYILDPKCLSFVPKKFYDMPTLFKKIISKKYKTVSFPLNENWIDIGKMEDYKLAMTQFKKYT
jgi:dTDP-glucose pyrophosphorylase/predicted transcriptional regulator